MINLINRFSFIHFLANINPVSQVFSVSFTSITNIFNCLPTDKTQLITPNCSDLHAELAASLFGDVFLYQEQESSSVLMGRWMKLNTGKPWKKPC